MKIICIGRNYLDHAKEMNATVPEKPLYFLKSDICIHRESQKFFYPEFTNDLHYECELVVKINRLGKYIDTKFAHKYYSHVSLGLDLTARDIQKKCKERATHGKSQNPLIKVLQFQGNGFLSKTFQWKRYPLNYFKTIP